MSRYPNYPSSPLDFPRLLHLRSQCLLLTSTVVISVQPIVGASKFVVLILVIIVIVILVLTPMLTRWNPRVPVVEWGVLAGKIVSALGARFDVVAASCRERPRAHRELGADGSLLCDPVGKGVFTVLDNGFTSLVPVVRRARLARRHWGVVNELKQVFAVARDNGDLLAVLAQSIELICICGLNLLACNI